MNDIELPESRRAVIGLSLTLTGTDLASTNLYQPAHLFLVHNTDQSVLVSSGGKQTLCVLAADNDNIPKSENLTEQCVPRLPSKTPGVLSLGRLKSLISSRAGRDVDPFLAFSYCRANFAAVNPSSGSCSLTHVLVSGGSTRSSCSKMMDSANSSLLLRSGRIQRR